MRHKIIVILSFMFAICLCGCNKQNTSQTYTPEAAGNADAATAYYSSFSVMTEADSMNDAVDMGDKICIICSMKGKDESEHIYRMVTVDKEKKEILSTKDITLAHSSNFFCSLPEDKLVLAYPGGFYIADPVSGEIITEESIAGVLSDDESLVASSGDGFFYVTPSMIYRVSSQGKIEDSMELAIEGQLIWNNTCFNQNGHYYLATFDGSSRVYYYEIDFELHTVSRITDTDAMGKVPYNVFEYGRYGYDDTDGVIYEMDVAGASPVVCAYMNNMIVKPSTGMPHNLIILNKDCFVQAYSYSGTKMHEIVIITRDDTLNLSGREKISVAGDYVTNDNSLAVAAYNYNMSQDKFYVTIDSWGDEYGWNSSKDAEQRNLKLIKDMQRGNAPDILYGYSLDFNSLGRMGVVLDMMPYIKNSKIITRDNLNDRLFDLMTKDGHCYQLFNGYAFNGFCGSKISGVNGMDFYSNAANKNNLNGVYNAVDLLNFMVGYPLEQLGSGGDFISEEEVASAIDLSVSLGYPPDSQTENVMITDHNGSINYGTYGSIPGLVNASDKGSFEFYGFPTYGGNSYCVEPMGLAAISSGSKNPEACFDFLEYMYSRDSQRAVLSNNFFPMNDEVFDEYRNALSKPDSIPKDDYLMILLASELMELRGDEAVYKEIPAEFFSDFDRAVNSVNKVMYVDFAIYNILTDELNSYYQQGKNSKEIATSLRSRLMLYLSENSI